ncbi:MAG: hypothetical protein J6T54_12335 [Fibrobacter sp.]|nr:hypothetical protein [Fibrobacter sp.]
MNTENRYKFLNSIYEELENAERKHPVFCDTMTRVDLDGIISSLESYRVLNSSAPYSANSILEEEIHEAMEAYLKGEREHCLQELAQCGAVILRMMEFVKNEMEAR